MRSVSLDRVEVAGRLIVAGALIAAGLVSSRQPLEFLRAIYQYELVGPPLAHVLAFALPALEVALGCLLLFDVARPLSLLAATVLFFAYATAQSIALIRGLDVPCACFGSYSSGDRIGAASIARTLVLLAASAMLLVLSWRRRPQENRSGAAVQIV